MNEVFMLVYESKGVYTDESVEIEKYAWSVL